MLGQVFEIPALIATGALLAWLLLRKRLGTRNEAELARLRDVFRSAPTAIAVQHGEDLVFTDVNPLYAKFAGGRDIVGMTFREAFPDTAKRQVLDARERAYRRGETVLMRDVPGVGESSSKFFNIYYVPLRSDRGKIDGVVVHVEEVTQSVIERKRAQAMAEKAYAAEQQLLKILNELPVVLWAIDRDGILTLTEGKGLADLGQAPGEIVGTSQFEAAKDNPQLIEMIRRALAGETVSLSSVHQNRVYENHISPIFGLDGQVTGAVGISFDITVQQRAERERGEFVAREKAMIEATRLKGEFLANMSHEIRTPLNAVIGITDLLLETDLDEQQRKYARVVQDSGVGLLTIINDILDFSKIEAGKLELETVDLSLVAVVESQADLLMARAKERGLSLMTFVSPDLPSHVRGDPGRIGQILLNLIGNALKFTQHGSVVVRATPNYDGGGVRFEIVDTGIGMSEEVRHKLFQPFTQADQSTARKFGGTGLGLSICKRLVDLMGGSIGVESVEGQGSTFWFVLPLEAAPAPEASSERPSLDAKKVRALVVDDDPIATEIVSTYLARWGVLVDVATNGDQAIEFMRMRADAAEPYDVAIVDKRMPEMDGFRLAKTIREDDELFRTRLILATGFDLANQREAAAAAGFDAYLTKPVRQSELYDAILDATALRGRVKKGPKHSPKAGALPRDAELPQNGIRVLVAEDNPVNQMLTLTLLKSLGYSARAVANGKEAVDAYLTGSYDMILMDCQMPEMDGYQAVGAIRKYETEQGAGHIPVIALTANAMKEDQAKCLAAGMDDYASKPVRKDRLEAVLKRWAPVVDRKRAA